MVLQAAAFGQTGSTVLPLSTQANVWLNAGSGVTTSGSAVTTWADQSGITGRNATQSTGAARPALVSSGSNFAGQPVLQFDGGDWLSGTWRATSGATQASLFAVYRLASNGGTQVPVMVGPGANSQGVGVGWNNSGYFNSFLWAGAESKINGFNSNTLIHAGTISGSSGSLWLNGQTATATGGSASLGNTYTVGRAGNNNFNLGAGSQLAEIVIFDSALGAADVTAMGNYLAGKYGAATTTSRLWSGGSSDATAASNWGGTLASGDQLVFQGATATSPTIGSTDMTVAGIAFTKQATDATTTAAFTLGGSGTITVGANGIANWAAATQTIATPLSLSATAAWNAVGDIAVTSNIAGSGGLTKAGAGRLTLSGSNTYSGLTTISAGTLSVAADSAIGSGTLSLGAGTLEVTGSTAFSTNRAVALTGGGSIAAANSAGTTLSGVLSGTGGLTKTGAGTLTLSGSNSYSGVTTVSAGTLAIATASSLPGFSTNSAYSVGSSATLSVGNGVTDDEIALILGTTNLQAGARLGFDTSAGDRTYAASITDTSQGSLGLGKDGGGRLTLSGSNTYSGLTTISAGTLSVAADSTLGSGTLSLGAGTLEVTGSTAFSTNRAVTLTGGGSIAAANSAGTTLSGVLSGTGGLTKTGAGTLTLANANNTYTGQTRVSAGVLALGVTNALPNQSTLLVDGGGFSLVGFDDAVADVTITSGSIYGSGKLTAATYALGGGAVAANLGAGTLRVTANSSLTGSSDATAVNLDAGTLTLGSGGRFTSTLVAVSGSSGASLTLGGNEAFGSLAGAANVALGANRLTVGSNGTSTTYSGVLAGTGGLTKVGTGKLILAGSNNYSGTTQLSAGTLAVNGSIAGDVQLDGGAILGGSGAVAGVLSGAGLVSPGNSPGILTASQFDPTSGLDAAFEFTAFTPNYASATASLNDVLRLTSGTPFPSSLGSGNVIDVYFNVESIATGNIFEGGFFTSLSVNDLLLKVQDASFQYWVKDTNGSTPFNGVNYSSLTSLPGITGVTVNAVLRTTDFGSGTVTGSVTQFVIVPEPSTGILIATAVAAAATAARSRRRGR